MWGLIIASGVCGLLIGRYFRIYAPSWAKAAPRAPSTYVRFTPVATE
jgi:hypothetical protein